MSSIRRTLFSAELELHGDDVTLSLVTRDSARCDNSPGNSKNWNENEYWMQCMNAVWSGPEHASAKYRYSIMHSGLTSFHVRKIWLNGFLVETQKPLSTQLTHSTALDVAWFPQAKAYSRPKVRMFDDVDSSDIVSVARWRSGWAIVLAIWNPGFNPSRCAIECDLGQVIHTHFASVTKHELGWE